MGKTSEVLDMGSLQAKLERFGFEAVSVDGHHEAALHAAINQHSYSGSIAPKALISKTVKGKGVTFM